MRLEVTPIERSIPISFLCWNKFADMFADSAKKQRNIVSEMITEKTMFKMWEILSVVVVSPKPTTAKVMSAPSAAS